jgi:predicted metalloprotease with PDZ domain
MRSRLARIVCAFALLGPSALAGAQTIELSVDLRDAPRHVLHARQTIPAKPGPLTLVYPKWIPGEHDASGQVVDVAGLRISAGKRELHWERDPADMFAFRIEVPPGASRVEVELDFLVPSSRGSGVTGPAVSPRVLVLNWSNVVLYPAGVQAADLQITPEITLPAGWEPATALRILEKRGGRVRYVPVTLETLIDSPVSAGVHYRAIPLAAPAGAPEHVLHLVADDTTALALPSETNAALQRLVPEAYAIFEVPHYGRYDFLVTLSDHAGVIGLEHHESTDIRMPERTFLEEGQWRTWASVFAHELVHTWNGKYRRPKGMATPDYQQAQRTEMLWVYEGLTEYLGSVLAARSGLLSPQFVRDVIAFEAAGLGAGRGRDWRPLGDTARSAQDLFGVRFEGSGWRRSLDFYSEGALLWLEVDARIRTATQGAVSLDDFCRRFFGPPQSGPEVRPYERAELVAALNEVAPGVWDAFFRERVDRVRALAPVEGIEAAGWKLAYDDEPNAYAEDAASGPDAGLDLRLTLGVYLNGEQTVVDVLPGSPAARAGLTSGATLVAVGSRTFSPERLADALAEAQRSGAPIELLAQTADFFTTHRVDYRGGERHPHLVRDETKPDLLSEILRPRTWTPPAESEPEKRATH